MARQKTVISLAGTGVLALGGYGALWWSVVAPRLDGEISLFFIIWAGLIPMGFLAFAVVVVRARKKTLSEAAPTWMCIATGVGGTAMTLLGAATYVLASLGCHFHPGGCVLISPSKGLFWLGLVIALVTAFLAARQRSGHRDVRNQRIQTDVEQRWLVP